MIAFERHAVTLEHMNVRTQKHGEEEKPMLDLKFRADLPNTALDRLSPGLRPSLYRPDGDGDLIDADHMPVLRHPKLAPLHFVGEVHPVKLVMHLGNRARDDLVLAGGKLGKVTVKALEGGTFTYGFRLQVEPNEANNKLINEVLRHEVPATLDLSEAGAVTDEDEGEA
jgi:hypothetical protein